MSRRRTAPKTGPSPPRKRTGDTTTNSLRDQFIRTNMDLFLLGAAFAVCNSFPTAANANLFDGEPYQVLSATTPSSPVSGNADVDYDEDDEEDIDPVYAVLFPWFTQAVAIFIYYIISRYLKALPYTAIVFLLGTAIGYVTSSNQENALAYSASIWLGINGQIILLVFLPGLIFHDSFTINVHLFFQAFWQLIIFAFPMVLAGAGLTALVAKYILPYEWSDSLCMTFGAILAGTDPIAVAGLLSSAGAPQRLTMHISGESLLNDGSVVVLFNIFSNLFFYELRLPNFGEQISFGQGFAYFFRLSLGGCAIGLAFGLCTVLMLKLIGRRLSGEENVAQVVLTVSSAYLAYFTSEIICQCSGIMSTIACGITVKVLGETFVNDYNLTLHFWQVTAELLNTLLFVLGGCLWGDIISKDSFSTNALDWGYLVLLFVLLIAIRFVLVFGLYPITSRIGIGTNVKESIFMSYGGFRGSVGIALALSLNAQIIEGTENQAYRASTEKLFCMVGGISLLTLLINGMTSGPLLKALNLAAEEKQRQAVIENYKEQMVQITLQEYVRLLSQERWRGIDHSVIKEHVPYLDFNFDDLMVAVERNKNNTPVHLYIRPRLEHVFPYLKGNQVQCNMILSLRSKSFEQLFKSQSYERLVALERASPRSPARRSMKDNCDWTHVFDSPSESNLESNESEQHVGDVNELRLNYVEILRSSYYDQIENGSLEERGDLSYSLFQGLDFCESACAKGEPLNDWEATKVASDTRVVLANRIFAMLIRRFKQVCRRERRCCGGLCGFDLINTFKIRFLVRQNLAFVRAHRRAQQVFESQFASKPLTPAEAQIIEESNAQIRLAEADLSGIDQATVNAVKGHLLSLIILNKSVKYVEHLSRQRLIPEAAASELLEVLDGHVENVWLCEKLAHDGRLSTSTQVARLKQLPRNILDEFEIWDAIGEMSGTGLDQPMTPKDRNTLGSIFRERSGEDEESTGDNMCVETALNTNESDLSEVVIPRSLPSCTTDESDAPISF